MQEPVGKISFQRVRKLWALRSEIDRQRPSVQIVQAQTPVTPTALAGRFDRDLSEQEAEIGSELSDEG